MFKYTLDNKRYHTLNYYLKNKYHTKVVKISLNAGFTCPNIDGKVGTGGCIYCSKSGSGEFGGDITKPLEEQFYEIKQKIEKKRLIVRAFDSSSLEVRFRNIQQPLLNRFDKAKQGLKDGILDKIKDYRTKLATYKTILENASPQTILNRGYSMVHDEKGTVIRDSSQVAEGQTLKITPSKGVIEVIVK